MKTAGIIGGIGPESTIEYYRSIVASYREKKRDGGYPPIMIASIDLSRLLDLVGANDLQGLTKYLSVEVNKLARAGVEFGALAANTPHIVFDALAREASIPLISIVDVTLRAAEARGLKRVGLLGTQFTMQASFYSEAFARVGVTVVVPAPEDRAYVHDKYVSELLNGTIRAETRRGLLAVVERLRVYDGIEGLILGGTELSLILGDVKDAAIPFLDTTKLHVQEIVRWILS